MSFILFSQKKGMITRPLKSFIKASLELHAEDVARFLAEFTKDHDLPENTLCHVLVSEDTVYLFDGHFVPGTLASSQINCPERSLTDLFQELVLLGKVDPGWWRGLSGRCGFHDNLTGPV